MQKVHRSYGDNGELKSYTIKKEMATRVARYATAHKRTQLLEDLKALAFTFTVMAMLVVWFLINN